MNWFNKFNSEDERDPFSAGLIKEELMKKDSMALTLMKTIDFDKKVNGKLPKIIKLNPSEYMTLLNECRIQSGKTQDGREMLSLTHFMRVKIEVVAFPDNDETTDKHRWPK